jgi:hypothetical protein
LGNGGGASTRTLPRIDMIEKSNREGRVK